MLSELFFSSKIPLWLLSQGSNLTGVELVTSFFPDSQASLVLSKVLNVEVYFALYTVYEFYR